jgi:hypothetical protein
MEKQERSIGELFSDLATETTTLIRQEIELAKVELIEKISNMGRNAVYVVAGGLVGYAALLCLLATIILALAIVIPAWASALLVTVVVGIVAAVLISKGIAALKKANLAPRQTVETLKEDVRWAKQQVR